MSEKSLSDVDTEKKPPVTPPAPPLELCCMSGCQNCVMIQHAEELLKLYNDDRAARAAIEEIPDENLKAFLKIELNLKSYLSKKLFRTLNDYVIYSTDDQF